MSEQKSLVELNDLTQGQDGVFYRGAEPKDFNYSDGIAVEQNLYQILNAATDLSSDSSELQSQIVDWPTEYHLSSARSNLLRAIDLNGPKRILELGCGCGSITRYLGEQAHLEIDAVEGSPARAKLAALRCRDLDNVTISVANFNELVLPDDYYDLVIFVGVTEYAGRFSERDSDQQALQDLLAMAYQATKSNGVTLVAIENRVGLKYLQGANEDHYALPYVGLHDYPDSIGIRTYTKPEWLTQISAANFVESQFLYPFPDYKIPTVVLDESNSKNPDQVKKSLKNIRSRDYTSNFSLGEQELAKWVALASAGTLADHANSFLILLAKQQDVLSQYASNGVFEREVSTAQYWQANDQSQSCEQLKSKDLLENHQFEIEQKNKVIGQLKTELEDLRNRFRLLEGSRGVKVLALFRRYLGRS